MSGRSPASVITALGLKMAQRSFKPSMENPGNRRCAAEGQLRLARHLMLAISMLLACDRSGYGQASAEQAQERQAWEIAAGGKMEFEVAAIKLGDPNKFMPPNITLSAEDTPVPAGGRFMADFPLVVYFEFAYKIMLTREEREAMLAHVPKWVDSKPFVVEARTPAGNYTKDQIRLMMQSLLADRFKLVVHFETREMPVFALITIKPGKTGPGLQPHEKGPPCNAKWTRPPDLRAPSVAPGGFIGICREVALFGEPDQTFLWGSRDLTVDHLAQYLPMILQVNRPIIDRTGLQGTFDFTLQFTPEMNGPATGAAEAQGPTPLEALKEQFGLTIKPDKAPVRVPVIDHVEEPSPN